MPCGFAHRRHRKMLSYIQTKSRFSTSNLIVMSLLVVAVTSQYSFKQPLDLSKVFNYPLNVRQIPGGQRFCPVESGSTACKASTRCSPWSAQILRQPHWCWALDGSYGACCPDITQTTASVARFPEVSRLTALPRDVTDEEMDQIISVAQRHINDITSNVRKTWDDMLGPWSNSAPFSYSASTRSLSSGVVQGLKGLQSVETSRKIAHLLKLEPKEAGVSLQHLDVRKTALHSICPPQTACNFSHYRSYDGSCNNLDKSNWGRSNTELERILPPQYADGIWAPREWHGLPPVDYISSLVTDINVPDNQLTTTVMNWGQFLAHDIIHTPTYQTLNNTHIQCCTPDSKHLPAKDTHPLCFPINVALDHSFYSKFGVQCHSFVRSVIAPRDDCKLGFANQLNQNTAYIDGSALYGSTESVARSLREFKGGRMKATVIDDNYVLLPIDPKRRDCISDKHGSQCFVAGDLRVNQYPGLTVMHTVWLRLHNLYAAQLSQINPNWDDERLYQETRRIIAALMQHITYNEYLPTIIGPHLMEEYGLMPLTSGYLHSYDPNVKVQLTNEFTTAAFRFGHSLISNFDELWVDDTYSKYGGELHLKDWFNNPKILLDPVLLNAMIRNFITKPAQNVDTHVAEAVHHYLFKPPHLNWGLDLVSINLWRGRDHGIGGYNFYLEACGIKRATSFDDLLSVIRPEVVEKLKRSYASVDDIDLFLGLMGEWAVKGGIVGPVTSCIIADQFSRLKDGDRFFYENGALPTSFTPAQLDSIRSMSFARVLCHVSDTVDWVTPNVFWTPSLTNPWLPCRGQDIPQIDLRLWKSSH